MPNLAAFVKSQFGGVNATMLDDLTLAGAVASKADGGTIAHGLGSAPTLYGVFSTAGGHIASVTAVDATNLTIALKNHDGTAVSTPENVMWFARV